MLAIIRNIHERSESINKFDQVQPINLCTSEKTFGKTGSATDRNFGSDPIEIFALMTLSLPTNNSKGMHASMHFPSLSLGRPHNPPMKFTRNKALSASLDSDP